MATPDAALAGEADIAKAFQELHRGEKTATVMETQLTALESKIDELLASAEGESSDDAAHMLNGGQKVVEEPPAVLNTLRVTDEDAVPAATIVPSA